MCTDTKDRRKDFESLKEKDDIDQRTIALNAIRIEKLYETLNALKIKIFEFRQLSDKEITDCRFERDYFRDAYFTIQKRLLSGNDVPDSLYLFFKMPQS